MKWSNQDRNQCQYGKDALADRGLTSRVTAKAAFQQQKDAQWNMTSFMFLLPGNVKNYNSLHIEKHLSLKSEYASYGHQF